MIVRGKIASSSDQKIIPADDDAILVINNSTGAQEGSGIISAGSYAVTMTNKAASFQGTLVVFRLKRGASIYSLENSSAGNATLAFNGSTMFPVQSIFNLVATSKLLTSPGSASSGTESTSSSSASASSTANSTSNSTTTASTSTATTSTVTVGAAAGTGTAATTATTANTVDVNGDGVIDEADIVLLKKGISGQTPTTTKMDVNNDGVVNTRDLIDLIRSVRSTARQSRK